MSVKSGVCPKESSDVGTKRNLPVEPFAQEKKRKTNETDQPEQGKENQTPQNQSDPPSSTNSNLRKAFEHKGDPKPIFHIEFEPGEADFDEWTSISKQQLTKALEENPHLSKISFLGADVKYVERLLHKRFRYLLVDPVVALTIDGEHNEILDQEAWRLIQIFRKTNSIFWRESDPFRIFDLIAELGKVYFCGSCIPECIYTMSWYQVEDALIAHAEVDTESG